MLEFLKYFMAVGRFCFCVFFLPRDRKIHWKNKHFMVMLLKFAGFVFKFPPSALLASDTDERSKVKQMSTNSG